MEWGTALASGVTSALGQYMTNRQNAYEAQKNRNFQRAMSDTAHQRETKDLEAAGLNRILSLSGSGASSPGGATARMENAVGAGVSSALQYRQLKKDIDLADQKMDLDKASEENQKQGAEVNKASVKKLDVETDILKEEGKARKEEAKFRADKAKLDNKVYKVEKYMNLINNGLGTLGKGVDIFKGGVDINNSMNNPRKSNRFKLSH